jgi:hypothetical protein
MSNELDYFSIEGATFTGDDDGISQISAVTDEVLNAMLRLDMYKPYVMDFGGGVADIPVKALLVLTENSPAKLLTSIGMNKTKENLAWAAGLLQDCNNLLGKAAYRT